MLNLVVLRSANPQAMVAFYEALGRVFALHRHCDGPEHWTDESGPVVFEIYAASEAQPQTTGLRLGFRVFALNETLVSATNAGGRVASKPKLSVWGLRAVIVDPDGNRVELTQEGKNDAATTESVG